MHIAYRNKKLLEEESGIISHASLEKLVRKIKHKYPMLYEEVGSKNVMKILEIVFRNSKQKKT